MADYVTRFKTVGSTSIADDSIVDIDINSAAAIDGSKINPAFTSNMNITPAAGDAKLTIESVDDPALVFVTSGANSFTVGLDDTDNDKLKFIPASTSPSAGTPAMTIEIGGNVGIGTTSPLTDLHVRDGATDGQIRVGGSGTTLGMLFDYVQSGDTIGTIASSPGYSSSGAAQLTFDVGETSDIMTLKASGNVGIGITSPSKNLQVHQGDSGESTMKFSNTTTGSAAGDAFDIGIDSSENVILLNHRDSDIVLSTDNTERVRIGKAGSSITLSPANSTIVLNGDVVGQKTTRREREFANPADGVIGTASLGSAGFITIIQTNNNGVGGTRYTFNAMQAARANSVTQIHQWGYGGTGHGSLSIDDSTREITSTGLSGSPAVIIVVECYWGDFTFT